MNSIFLLLIVVFSLPVSNNQPVRQEVMAAAATAHIQKDSPGKKDTTVKPFSYVLTQAEMQDDTVFADGSEPVSWANAGFNHPVAFKRFLKRLQYWVAHQQKDSVAAAIVFPLQYPSLKNAAAFLARYNTLINEKVKKALVAQNLRQIFRRNQGAMIGDGVLWLTETKKGFKIIAINN